MTIQELEMRQWLNRAFYADKKAKALEALAQQCREHAQGLSASLECNDKGKSDGAENGTENALMRLVEIEEKIIKLRVECAYVISETLETIWSLRDDDLEAVLINRYILYYTIEQTAEIMHYAPRTVRKKQKQAIEKLCLLMPCNASSDVV